MEYEVPSVWVWKVRRESVCVYMCVCACAYIAMGECKYINKQGKYNKKECLCFCYFTYELKNAILILWNVKQLLCFIILGG